MKTQPAKLTSISVAEFEKEMALWSEHHGKKPLTPELIYKYHSSIKSMTLKQVQAGINDAIIEGAFFKDIMTVISKRKGIDHNREQLEQEANKAFDLVYESFMDQDSSPNGEKRAEAFAARAYSETLSGREFNADFYEYTPLDVIREKLTSQKTPPKVPARAAADPNPLEIDEILNSVMTGMGNS